MQMKTKKSGVENVNVPRNLKKALPRTEDMV